MHRLTITRWLRQMGALLAPEFCGLCGLPSNGSDFCPPCYGDLPFIDYRCERCGSPLAVSIDVSDAPLDLPTPCARCQREPPPFRVAYAPLHYAFPADALLKAFKFRGRLDLARPLAHCMLPWLQEHRSAFDALVPVPLYRWRNARRGFNQADELAGQLRRATGIAVHHSVRRIRRTATQSGLDAVERRRNMRGAFRVRSTPSFRNALIIDDVMTTGTTVRELSATLLAAGVESVSVLTVAHASL